MRVAKRIERALLRRLLPQPVAVRHAEYSMVFSADDEPGKPSARLLATALAAIEQAQRISLREISARMGEPPYFPDVWPGETYRLLAGFMAVVQPARVVEVGTGGGTSTLTIKRFLPPGGSLVTFDVLPWTAWPGCLLRDEDFRDGRLIQHTDDVSQPALFAKHRAVFEDAELIFLDAAKDGVMEQALLDQLGTVRCRVAPLLFLDDIRVWNMLKIWRRIARPKLDLTSFGHWTGSGVVEWTAEPHRPAPA